jgi:hypothetical protein
MQKKTKILSFIFVLFIILPVRMCGQTPEKGDDYKLKSSVLFLFTKFVQFPSGSYNPSALVIGLLGESPIEKHLSEQCVFNSVNYRKYIFKKYKTVHEIENCQILFISSSEESKLQSVLQKLKKIPVLTVSDANNFCQKGGMIRLLSIKNSIKFEVNLTPARVSGLNIGSQMLNSALYVYKLK